MGSGTLLQNSMGSVEPMEPMLTQPLLMVYLEWTLFQRVFCRIAIQSEKMVSAPKSTERPIANCKE